MYRRFKKLDKDGSGTLTTDEFLSIPEFASNPLLERVIAIFDTNKDEEIEFKEFISALSIFSSKENKEAKLRCTPPPRAPLAPYSPMQLLSASTISTMTDVRSPCASPSSCRSDARSQSSRTASFSKC